VGYQTALLKCVPIQAFWLLGFAIIGNENNIAFLSVRELNNREENSNLNGIFFIYFSWDFLGVESSPKSSPVIMKHIKWELSYFKIM
jgi:hypothetical protein